MQDLRDKALGGSACVGRLWGFECTCAQCGSEEVILGFEEGRFWIGCRVCGDVFESPIIVGWDWRFRRDGVEDVRPGGVSARVYAGMAGEAKAKVRPVAGRPAGAVPWSERKAAHLRDYMRKWRAAKRAE